MDLPLSNPDVCQVLSYCWLYPHCNIVFFIRFHKILYKGLVKITIEITTHDPKIIMKPHQPPPALQQTGAPGHCW